MTASFVVLTIMTNDTGFSSSENVHIPALDGDLEQGGSESQETTDTSAEETNIPALDGDEGAAEDESEGDDEQDQDGDEGDEEDASSDDQKATDTRESLMQKFAEEMGLNLNDPREKKIAQRLADKELHIRKLRGEQGAKGQQKVTTTEDGLTEFERGLRSSQKDAKQETPAQQPAAKSEAAAKSEESDVEDAGAKWNSPSDAWTDLNKAWTEGNLEAVSNIEAAIFNRQFGAIAAPQIKNFVQSELQKFFKENLGDVVPQMKQSVAERRHADAKDFAISQLSAVKGFEGVNELDVKADGDPVVFNGAEFDNTPMNRIIAENPWILSIQEKHADPDKAQKLTMMARYRAAFKVHQAGKVPSTKAKQLVEAGKKMEARTRNERTRQSLNGGNGAGTSLTQSKGKSKGYVADELLGLDEPTSFASF